MSSRLNDDSLKLKAAIEFGSEYDYTIRNGGHGPTLVVDTPNKTIARVARTNIPTQWEGLYVIITYCTAPEEEVSISDPTVS